MSYTHGGGIDRPLALHKEGWQSILPHENWRGQFASGTCVPDATVPCGSPQWPGWQTNAYHALTTPPQNEAWLGSLVDDMRDATGQMYKRNRYYDPQTGQFTQPDPIGIAGGLNVYGFAAGDPVTYSDPYGLCPEEGSSFECPIVLPEVTVAASRYTLMEIDGTDLLIGGGIVGKGAAAARPLLARLGGGLRQLLGRRVLSNPDEVFRTAQEGGKHAGFLRNYAGRSGREMQTAIRSLQRRAGEHEGFLADPTSHVRNWSELRPQHQQSLLRHWRSEIQSAREQIQILERLQ